MNELALVSVVIPTRNRPELVCRAIASARKQTYREIEIVVVVDGPDPATLSAIRNLQEPKIKVVSLSESVGGSEARNIGVREARGEWIAFLDDDDEWLPQKLEKQINAIVNCGGNFNFAACRYHFLDGTRSSLQPEVFPRPGQNIGEYLFCEISRSGHRRSVVLTSTWLVKRDLCINSPFTRGLRRHQDTDWLLKAHENHQVLPCFISDPCTLIHGEADRVRISTTAPDWRFTFVWANEAYLHLTPKAKAYIYGTLCAYETRQEKSAIRNLYFLWKQCDRSVRFTPDLLFHFSRALFSALTFRHRYVRTSWLWLRGLTSGGAMMHLREQRGNGARFSEHIESRMQ